MAEPSFQYRTGRADRLKAELRKLLEMLVGWAAS